jgi:hypothetical protein
VAVGHHPEFSWKSTGANYFDGQEGLMESQAAKTFSVIETISKTVSFIAVGVSAIAALLQYQSNSEAEARMRVLAQLESDIKISTLFSELIQKANGYGNFSQPIEPVIEKLFSRIPDEHFDKLLQGNPPPLSGLLGLSVIPTRVPLSAAISAAESIANLAIKYPILKEPAIEGLRIVITFLPQTTKSLERVCNFYNTRCEMPINTVK